MTPRLMLRVMACGSGGEGSAADVVPRPVDAFLVSARALLPQHMLTCVSACAETQNLAGGAITIALSVCLAAHSAQPAAVVKTHDKARELVWKHTNDVIAAALKSPV